MEHMLPTFTIVLERPGQEDVESLLRIRGMWDRNCELLRDKLDFADRQREAINVMIEFATGASEPGSAEQLVSSTETPERHKATFPQTESANGYAEPVSGAATVKDITHCRTQREASYVIAEINGGHIDLKSAARVIDAAGLSKGLLNTIVSSLHNFMSHSDDWSYTGPSRFELLTRREGALESASEPDSGDEDSPKSNVVQGNSMMAHILNETAA